jgi:hypothetical protein
MAVFMLGAEAELMLAGTTSMALPYMGGRSGTMGLCGVEVAVKQGLRRLGRRRGESPWPCSC